MFVLPVTFIIYIWSDDSTSRLTCNFNPRSHGMNTHLDLRSLFVSISRVKSIDHIRIVPMINGDRSKLNYLRKFSMDPKVRILPRCYNEHGQWIASTDDIIHWFDEFGIQWRPKATVKHPLNEFQKEINSRYPLFIQNKNNVCNSQAVVGDKVVKTPKRKTDSSIHGSNSHSRRSRLEIESR